jgi:hypothetical protein
VLGFINGAVLELCFFRITSAVGFQCHDVQQPAPVLSRQLLFLPNARFRLRYLSACLLNLVISQYRPRTKRLSRAHSIKTSEQPVLDPTFVD